MRDSETGSRRGHPTAIVVGLLVVFLIATPVALIVLNRDGKSDKKAKRALSTTVPTVASTTTTTRGVVHYTVQQGDTILAIAKRFSVPPRVILEANRLTNPDEIFAGQVLTIPPPRIVRLVVKPAKVKQGEGVEIRLSGAEPSENVTFEIDSPTGKFTGPPHSASLSGKVVTSYSAAPDAAVGTYTVIARGDQVVNVYTTFVVEAAPLP